MPSKANFSSTTDYLFLDRRPVAIKPQFTVQYLVLICPFVFCVIVANSLRFQRKDNKTA